MKSAKQGFTLVELLMVVALIAIVSTLAVSKVGAVREASARRVSLANQKAVERAVEAYLAEEGRLNRLDSLIYAGNGGAPIRISANGDFDFSATSTAEGREGLYLGPSADADATVREASNRGLSDGLRSVLCLYGLSREQVAALNLRLGLKYVMAHTAYADAAANVTPADHYPRSRPYGDGTVPDVPDGLNANDSACVATILTNNMAVAAVNPMTDLGRAIYQACGQELFNTRNQGENYDETAVRAEVAATGGPLVAFGLGDSASIVGKANAGVEDAPHASFVPKVNYSRYILLFRLKTIGSGTSAPIIPEFAGVIDPDGNTFRSAQTVIGKL